MIPVFKPSLGDEEIQAVSRVIKSNWIGNGPRTEEFEKKFVKYVGGRFALAVNSASAALHLALLAGGIKKGDEVITPSFTFIATNHPILLVGAKPVFCDIDLNTLCADPKDIEQKITNKTKAIIVVHYGGIPVDLSPIQKLCTNKKILLIEDCAHAVGTYYKRKHVGVFGDFSCFSFAAIKNLTTGDGGMLIGKNKQAIKKARILAWSGISKSTWKRISKNSFSWKYNVSSVGWKYQMNDIAAAIGLSQLEKIDNNNKKREIIADRYNKAFSNLSWIKFLEYPSYGKSSHHNYVIKVYKGNRDKLSQYLSKKGIQTTVHYYPSHHYKLYKPFASKLPVTDKVWREILLLPIFPDLKSSEQEYIIDSVKSFNS